jgi:hypothetical protein
LARCQVHLITDDNGSRPQVPGANKATRILALDLHMGKRGYSIGPRLVRAVTRHAVVYLSLPSTLARNECPRLLVPVDRCELVQDVVINRRTVAAGRRLLETPDNRPIAGIGFCSEAADSSNSDALSSLACLSPLRHSSIDSSLVSELNSMMERQSLA